MVIFAKTFIVESALIRNENTQRFYSSAFLHGSFNRMQGGGYNSDKH